MSPAEFALVLINELAPRTRRDDWWEGDGPAIAVENVLRRAQQRIFGRLEEAKKFAGDTEAAHSTADEALCEMLIALGCENVVDEWRQIPKWYA